MAGILQFQRRAIEHLRHRADGRPVDFLRHAHRFTLHDGTALHALGVSTGVGTCSDVHGMNVLVMSERTSDEPEFRPSAATCDTGCVD